jgi:hypothetical protein
MTSYLYAKDLFKSELLKGQVNIRLMFDQHNPTVDEEVVTQRLQKVLVRPLAFGDK